MQLKRKRRTSITTKASSTNTLFFQQPMTTKMFKQSDSDTAEYLQELAEDGSDLLYGIQQLLEKFTLPAIQHQSLAEAAEQLSRVITTIEGAK